MARGRSAVPPAPPESSHALPALLASGAVGEVVMVAGYFLYEAAPVPVGLGLGALANVPFNLVQGVFGLVSAGAVIWPCSAPGRWPACKRLDLRRPPVWFQTGRRRFFAWIGAGRGSFGAQRAGAAGKTSDKPRSGALFRCFLWRFGVN